MKNFRRLLCLLGLSTLSFQLSTNQIFAADAANDLILTQVKSSGSGNIQRNVAPVASGIFTFDSSKVPTSISGATFISNYGLLTSAVAALAYQPLDSDLTSWAAITRASGFDTFTATPTGANLASLLTTALPASKGGTGLTSLGTGVATALGVNTGSAGAFVLFNGALGTPSSGTVTNLTGTASININGTVGATSPATLAATTGNFSSTLQTGNVTVGSSGAGSISASSLTSASSTDLTLTPGGNSNNVVIGNTLNGSYLDLGTFTTTTSLSPVRWGSGNRFGLYGSKQTWSGTVDNVGGLTYNAAASAVPNSDAQFGLQFESHFNNGAGGHDTELIYAWNGPDNQVTQIRPLQINTAWGPGYSATDPIGKTRITFNANVGTFGVGTGGSFADNFNLDFTATPHALTWDGAATIGGSISTTGSSGLGFFGFSQQASDASAPATGLRLYADTSNRMNVRVPAGNIATFSYNTLSTNRLFTWPDAAGTVALVSTTVPSIAGTAGNVLVNGGTTAVQGSAATLSLPTSLTSINNITAASSTDLVLTGGSSGMAVTLQNGTGRLVARKDANAQIYFSMQNQTSGTAAWISNGVFNGSYSAGVDLFSAGYTTSGTAIANSARLFADAPAGLNIVSQNEAVKIYRTSTLVATFDSPGVTVSKALFISPSALTYASPTSVDVTLASFYTVTTVNATGSVTFNATGPGTSGQHMTILITNDATSAKTITFTNNFTANGTLTPSGASKKATIEFISDGTAFVEVARTVLP